MTLDTSLPPALFDLEPVRREIVLTPFDGPFVPLEDRLCGMCRKLLRTLPTTHSCGGARDGGYFELCDDCACDDLGPSGRSRWGLTREHLAIDRARRRVYAAGGGEAELAAELARLGIGGAK